MRGEAWIEPAATGVAWMHLSPGGGMTHAWSITTITLEQSSSGRERWWERAGSTKAHQRSSATLGVLFVRLSLPPSLSCADPQM
eukprot:6039884-Prymnesium_polylepis.1